MIQKGYVEFDKDGKFFPRKPTISMAQLFERIFPRMPAMDLFAYIGQTVEEVESGRKPPESAISQFHQMLQIHGVSIAKERNGTEKQRIVKQATVRGSTVRRMEAIRRQEQRIGKDGALRLSDFYIPLKNVDLTEEPRTSPSEPKILSSDGAANGFEVQEVEIDDVSTEQVTSPETSQRKDELEEVEKQEIQGEETQQAAELVLSQTEEPQLAEEIQEREELTPAAESGHFYAEPEGGKPETGRDPGAEWHLSHEGVEEDDQSIESQIAAFEEGLAMQCPICRSAKVQREETVGGKFYYRCSNTNCTFISWGKPYHFACPQCTNPFLVETANRDGEVIMKCPRATCQYWQQAPGAMADQPQEKVISESQESAASVSTPKKPKRKVVRRRRVRRKR
jgi:hypothetical protein